MRKYLPISNETTQQLQEVVQHCGIRVDGWCLHIVIVLLALMSYHWGVQLSSPAAEIELPYFVTLMSQAIAMQLWQLTTSTTLAVFLVSSIFRSLGRLTLWSGGGLVTASIWGVVQFYLMIGKASYEGVITDDTTEIYSTFYFIPLFGFFLGNFDANSSAHGSSRFSNNGRKVVYAVLAQTTFTFKVDTPSGSHF